MNAPVAGRRLLLLPLLALLLGATMEWPKPMQWPELVERPRVAQALREALASREWQVEADTGESITARHEVREGVLRIRIDYSPHGLRYVYLDSRNYSYEEESGERYIHRRANKIMRQLDRAVRGQVQRLRAEREGAEVVPVEPLADGDDVPEESP